MMIFLARLNLNISGASISGNPHGEPDPTPPQRQSRHS